MWKTPYRPRESSLSQSYPDGMVTIYAVTDGAHPGYKPKPKFSMKGELAFAEQRVGLTRRYSALQSQVEVDRVVRIPKPSGFEISPQDVAVCTGSTKQYRIDQVQTVPDVFPPSLDLTLARMDQLPMKEVADSDLV